MKLKSLNSIKNNYIGRVFVLFLIETRSLHILVVEVVVD